MKHATEGHALAADMAALAARAIKCATLQGTARREMPQKSSRCERDQNARAAVAQIVQAQKQEPNSAAPGMQDVGKHMTPMQGVRAVLGVIEAGADTRQLVEKWRVETVLQSAPGSLARFASGLRCWAAFADGVLRARGRHLPPSAQGLVAWSRIFRNPGTFMNYVGSLRFGCDLANLPWDSDCSRVLKRARAAIANRAPPPRAKKSICEELVAELVWVANAERDHLAAMMYIIGYAFLLRIPSEALPLRTADVGVNPDEPLREGIHSAIMMKGDELVIRLRKRKNRPHGSVISRACWCKRCEHTCPVCVVGRWLQTVGPGVEIFKHITAHKATEDLRRRLKILKVQSANLYSLHGFRRGHAQDMLVRGKSLCEILRAGEWKSAAFMQYLDASELEAAAVVEAHFVESSEDEA
jgi:hypothetical protein